ncbi:MAG TPA: DUF3592 domain-containing protein [Candidatus Angelobacter sp.]|nr:DUF3592 domain-containing protein [Candidatus Angelobacter sp.]
MVRIVYVIPLAVVYLAVNLARRAGRWYDISRAHSWTKTHARVTGSYEIDENQSALSRNGWGDDRDDSDYHPRFAVAIQYSYRAGGELYSGTYFLPHTFTRGDLASEAEESWADRKIVVRYNPSRPRQSCFLVEDGAPGRPHIPRLLSYSPYITDLRLE